VWLARKEYTENEVPLALIEVHQRLRTALNNCDETKRILKRVSGGEERPTSPMAAILFDGVVTHKQ